MCSSCPSLRFELRRRFTDSNRHWFLLSSLNSDVIFSPSFSYGLIRFPILLKVLDSGNRLRTKPSIRSVLSHIARRLSYFHSQDWERLFPWASKLSGFVEAIGLKLVAL